MPDVQIVVTAATDQAKTNIEALGSSVDKLGPASEKAGLSFGNMVSAIGLGNIVAQTAVSIFHDIVDWFKQATDVAEEYEKAHLSLVAALTSTGREVQNTSAALEAQAEAYAQTTIYSKASVEGAQALLVQLTKLDDQGLSQATKAAIVFASITGDSLPMAARILERAMDGNFIMLQRWGITVNQAGTAAEKKTEILEKLGSMYGRVEADAASLGGQLEIEKHQLEESQAQIGNALLPVWLKLNKAVADVASSIFMYADALKYAQTATDRSNEAEDKTWDILTKITAHAHITGQAFTDLATKYNYSAAALEMAIEKGKEGVVLQDLLAKATQGGAAAYAAYAAAQAKAHQASLESDTDAEKAVKAAESLQIARSKEAADLAKQTMAGVALVKFDAENELAIKEAQWKKEGIGGKALADLMAQQVQIGNAKIAEAEFQLTVSIGKEADAQAKIKEKDSKESTDKVLEFLGRIDEERKEYAEVEAKVDESSTETAERQAKAKYDFQIKKLDDLRAHGKIVSDEEYTLAKKTLDAETALIDMHFSAWLLALGNFMEKWGKTISAGLELMKNAFSLIDQAAQASYAHQQAVEDKYYTKANADLDAHTAAVQKALDAQVAAENDALKTQDTAQKKSLDDQYAAEVAQIKATVKDKTKRDADLVKAKAEYDKKTQDMDKAQADAATALAAKQAADKAAMDQAAADAKKALDEQQALDKYNLDVKVFKSTQLQSEVNAAINTAEAVTKALTGFIPPWNFIMAAATLAYGVAQELVIAGEPGPVSPLAAGGLLDRPTFVAGEAGTEMVGNYGDIKRDLATIVDDAVSRRLVNRPMNITVHNYLDGKKIDSHTTRVVQSDLNLKRIQVPGAAIG